jgi:DnaK suppressor protein
MGDSIVGDAAPDAPAEETGLRPSEVEILRTQLEGERERVLDLLALRGASSLTNDSDVGDEADQASAEYERSTTLKIASKVTKLLAEIDHALAKFRDGTYGVCEGTEEPIGFRRLQARPWARYSLEFKEKLEREERGYHFDN